MTLYVFTVLPSKFALLSAQTRALREQEFLYNDKKRSSCFLIELPAAFLRRLC